MGAKDDIIIVGAGIGGLALALSLHQYGIRPRIYESFEQIKPLGVGINLLPHAMRELAMLGMDDAMLGRGVQISELCFFTRHGQKILAEPRGKYAGYKWPQVSIHRADLHLSLLQAVQERLGPDAVAFGHKCTGFAADEAGVTVRFAPTARNDALVEARGSLAIGCDGTHSAIRKQLRPQETGMRFEGTTMYRGTTRWPPFLSGTSMVYLGSVETGLLILYPIRDQIDAAGRQLVNWIVEIKGEAYLDRDWNQAASLDEFIGPFEHCAFDWLDVPAMLRAADMVLKYAMVDQEPLPFWTRGPVTLLGDAAHPMIPRGSNGAAQAIVDAATLGNLLGESGDGRVALAEYERIRLPATRDVVLANRSTGPSAIIQLVEQRSGGKPFRRLEDVIEPDEIRRWQDRYKKIAGFKVEDLNART